MISAPGHSSLAYLTRFPFRTLKIDNSLVIDKSDKGDILIRSIVDLAKQLDMRVVAEGVASEDDAMKLSEMGCDYGQSFLFGPPIGTDSVQKLLKERFPVAQAELIRVCRRKRLRRGRPRSTASPAQCPSTPGPGHICLNDRDRTRYRRWPGS